LKRYRPTAFVPKKEVKDPLHYDYTVRGARDATNRTDIKIESTPLQKTIFYFLKINISLQKPGNTLQ